MTSGPITSWQIEGGKVRDVIFLASKIIVVIAAMKLRCLLLERKAMTNLDSVLKSRDITANKGPYSQNYGLFSSHVWMWDQDHKEGSVLKYWCFLIVVLEKTPEIPLDCKEIKSVNPNRNQPWIFIWKDWCWSWSSNTLAIWCEELIHWKRSWCCKRLDAKVEETGKVWNG